jgi:diguanylate cyclase (GGDEF)-like protein/PAS domain S-box-containing protein
MSRQPAAPKSWSRHHERAEASGCDSAEVLGERRLVELLQSQAQAIVDASDDAIYAKTLDGIIVSWNRAAERLYGYSESEVIGEPVSMLCPPELRNELPQIMQQIKNGTRVDHYKTVRIKKGGSRINISVTISPILDARGRAIGASTIARDISDQKRSEESIRHLATHDSLTDLANYASLLEAFDTELRRSDRTGRPFALLLLDLDRLKEINDTWGHLVGTRALCRLAAILKRTCRSIDTAARYGGDEFAVLLVETDEAIASRVARRIASLLTKDYETPSFTVSAGIAVYPQDGYTVENLIAAADRGLYKNKLRMNLRGRICEVEMNNQGAIGDVTGAERRRSERLLLDVALVIRGESTERKQFHEETFTISISAHGTLLVMATKVELGQTLTLTNPQNQHEMEGRVVRFGSPYGGLAQVGVDFTKPAPRFWPVDSLPDSWRSIPA